MTNESRAYEILENILRIPHNKGFVGYAKTYAKAGLCLTGHALSIQLLYILNNLSHFTKRDNPNAPAIKKELKELCHLFPRLKS